MIGLPKLKLALWWNGGYNIYSNTLKGAFLVWILIEKYCKTYCKYLLWMDQKQKLQNRRISWEWGNCEFRLSFSLILPHFWKNQTWNHYSRGKKWNQYTIGASKVGQKIGSTSKVSKKLKTNRLQMKTVEEKTTWNYTRLSWYFCWLILDRKLWYFQIFW